MSDWPGGRPPILNDVLAFAIVEGYPREASHGALDELREVEKIVAANERLRALVTEAYSGEHPTNSWRKKAEDLGAWPVVSAGSAVGEAT